MMHFSPRVQIENLGRYGNLDREPSFNGNKGTTCNDHIVKNLKSQWIFRGKLDYDVDP